MRLNLEKCVFGVQGGKFLVFLLTSRGIKANPEKCRAILEMRSLSILKEVQQLTRRIAALSKFLARSAERVHLFPPFEEASRLQVDEECERAFQDLKKILVKPPVLSKPRDGELLYIYLSVTKKAISLVLKRE